MLGYVQIVPLYVFKHFIFSFKAKRGLHTAQTKVMPAKLRALLDTFEFSENEFADSAQC